MRSKKILYRLEHPSAMRLMGRDIGPNFIRWSAMVWNVTIDKPDQFGCSHQRILFYLNFFLQRLNESCNRENKKKPKKLIVGSGTIFSKTFLDLQNKLKEVGKPSDLKRIMVISNAYALISEIYFFDLDKCQDILNEIFRNLTEYYGVGFNFSCKKNIYLLKTEKYFINDVTKMEKNLPKDRLYRLYRVCFLGRIDKLTRLLKKSEYSGFLELYGFEACTQVVRGMAHFQREADTAFKIFQLLFLYGDQMNEFGVPFLCMQVINLRDIKLIKLLVEAGADLDQTINLDYDVLKSQSANKDVMDWFIRFGGFNALQIAQKLLADLGECEKAGKMNSEFKRMFGDYKELENFLESKADNKAVTNLSPKEPFGILSGITNHWTLTTL